MPDKPGDTPGSKADSTAEDSAGPQRTDTAQYRTAGRTASSDDVGQHSERHAPEGAATCNTVNPHHDDWLGCQPVYCIPAKPG